MAPTPCPSDRSSPWDDLKGSRPLVDFALLREQISIADVLRHLQWKPTEQHGDQLRGPCPIHGRSSDRATSRSFAVNLRKNAFKCWAPADRCGASGNQLDLAAAVWRVPVYEAALRLVAELGRALPVQATEKRNP